MIDNKKIQLNSEIIKRCRNNFCGKLIYSGQYGFQYGYCSKECSYEVLRFNSLNGGNKYRIQGVSKKALENKLQTEYPHNTLPIVLIID